MDTLSPEHRSWLMSRVKSTDTMPEWVVRRLFFAMGYRYRLHVRALPGKPDIVFVGRKKAVFVNGCFWHGHKGCRYSRLPKTRVEYWREKRDKNRSRDRASIYALQALGWKVLTVWQCELKNIETLTQKLHDFIEHD